MNAFTHGRLSEAREDIDRLYPGALALLLTPLCSASTPHDHHGVPCSDNLGKRPIRSGWNEEAVRGWRAGANRDEHIEELAHHLAGGGNVGWVIPPGALVLDADSPGAVRALEALMPDAPMQQSRPGRAHYVVAVPTELEIDATVKVDLGGFEIDLRSAGRSQIAVEPSRHASGSSYAWHRDMPEDLTDLPECPDQILERILKQAPRARRNESGRRIGEGERNAYLFRAACGMRSRGLSRSEIRDELHGENLRHCDPPLSAAEVDQIVESALRYPMGKSEAPEPAAASSNSCPSDFFDDSGLVVPRLGDAIRGRGHVCLGLDGRLYRYANGVYRGDGDTYSRALARELLGPKFKRRHLDEALTYLRSDFATVGDRQPDGLVNVRNGLLDWNALTPTLRDHRPEIVSTVQIPHRWEPSAKCPRIDEFLAEVVPDAVEFVLELVGYSLLPANPLRVAVLLLGPGRNGKSVPLAIIKALLGAENVSSVPLQALTENRFAAAELFGRLANICGDLDARAVRQTDIFKMLTGGDSVMAERKHRDPFTFVPYALPLFSANEAPISADQTEAWFDRWLVVPMERRIPEERVDPRLVAKLTTDEEIEGLVVKAVDGLRRLMARGCFKKPASVRHAGEQYRERLDTVAGFVADECRLDLQAWTPRRVLYPRYRAWANAGGRFPVSAATFYEHLRHRFAAKVVERTREGERGWLGLALREGP